MKKIVSLALAAVMLSVAADSTLAIDVIQRRSTSTKGQGEITAISKTEVTLKPRTGDAVAIPANDIVQIDWTGEPAGLKLARSDESGGRLQKALDSYNKLLGDIKSETPNLKVDVEFAIDRTIAKQALADPAKQDDAIKRLEEFRAKHGESYHFYTGLNLLGQLYLAKNDAAKAKSVYEALSQSPFNDAKMAAKIAGARLSLLENNPAAALPAFEAVSQMKADNPAEASKVQEAKLGIAQCLQLQKEYDKAIALLEKVIEDLPAEEAAIQAEAYLRQGDCLEASGKPKDALLAYLHVDVLFPAEKVRHAEALYHLAKLWGVVQQPERAADAADRLATEYPNSPWTQKVKAPAAE
jgi:tetratricopeptide (TPR) repeat protein